MSSHRSFIAIIVGATTALVSAPAHSQERARGSAGRCLAVDPLLTLPVPTRDDARVFNPAILRLQHQIRNIFHGPGPTLAFPRGGPLVQLRWTFSIDLMPDLQTPVVVDEGRPPTAAQRAPSRGRAATAQGIRVRLPARVGSPPVRRTPAERPSRRE